MDINDKHIRKANESDLDGVYSIISQCAMTLSEEGYNHWKNYYTYDRVKDHFKNHEVFVYEDSNGIIATISFSATPPDYYDNTYTKYFSTSANDQDALYFSKLGVSPMHRKKGLGKLMILYCENLAKNMGRTYVRFDARADIESLVKFYTGMDFKVVGQVTEENEPYYIYEKNLK